MNLITLRITDETSPEKLLRLLENAKFEDSENAAIDFALCFFGDAETTYHNMEALKKAMK